jgi:hypothetical protein
LSDRAMLADIVLIGYLYVFLISALHGPLIALRWHVACHYGIRSHAAPSVAVQPIEERVRCLP